MAPSRGGLHVPLPVILGCIVACLGLLMLGRRPIIPTMVAADAELVVRQVARQRATCPALFMLDSHDPVFQLAKRHTWQQAAFADRAFDAERCMLVYSSHGGQSPLLSRASRVESDLSVGGYSVRSFATPGQPTVVQIPELGRDTWARRMLMLSHALARYDFATLTLTEGDAFVCWLRWRALVNALASDGEEPVVAGWRRPSPPTHVGHYDMHFLVLNMGAAAALSAALTPALRRRALAARCYQGPTYYLGPVWTACAAQLRVGARMCDLSGQTALGADGDALMRHAVDQLLHPRHP